MLCIAKSPVREGLWEQCCESTPMPIGGLKCPRRVMRLAWQHLLQWQGKVLQVHSHSGFKCLLLSEWVGRYCKCLVHVDHAK